MTVEKKALRKEIGQRRAEAHSKVDPSPALSNLAELLSKTEGPVSFYWPIRTEIDPRPVMTELAKSRDVCLPVTEGFAPLSFRRWTEGAELDVDGFGVAVPAVNDPVVPRVLVVPMLAFDANCHRLGYGAGHYDRTLEKLRAEGPVLAYGLAYSAQQVADPLPTEQTDQALNAIVTESGVLRPER